LGNHDQEQTDQPDGGAAETARARRSKMIEVRGHYHVIDEVQEVPVLEVCIWRFEFGAFDRFWEPGCQGEQIVDCHPIKAEFDDEGPLQWGWRVCPYCSRPIVQRSPGGSK
jgi:hypothetical protein